ncbi:MAG TPA: hypothetical protein VMT89_12690 [Candidatus Acidoferrales bacterium]|nr:hypothetical protein [Candidatus Acidoferrales bacterium]
MHSRLYDMLTQIVISHARNSEPADFSAVLKPLTNIRQRAQRGGARVVVLVSPGLDKAEPAAIDDLVVLQRFAADGGIEVIDLSQWLKGIESKRIAMDICHFNEEGHRVLGERLADYLLKRDLKE